MAIVLGLISMFNVNSVVLGENQLKQQRIQGADIACYDRPNNPSVECSGEYYRGWPLKAGKGEFSVLDSGSLASQFNLKIENLFYNFGIWWVIMLSLAQADRKWRKL